MALETRPLHVLDPALGNARYDTAGGTDATAHIQGKLDAAAAPGGFATVVVPGGRCYRITNTLRHHQGVSLWFDGGRDGQGQSTPSTFVWDGAEGGSMIDVAVSTQNVFTTSWHNGCLIGKALRGTGKAAAHGVRFLGLNGAPAKADSGTIFDEMWFQSFAGDAIKFDRSCYGATNFRLTGGRFDNIWGGYGIHIDLNGDGHSFIGTIDGMTTYVGYGNNQGKGFLWLDAEQATSWGVSHLKIDSLHTECNAPLTPTWGYGYPSDQRGIIRLGVNPRLPNVQHALLLNSPHHSYPAVTATGRLPSHSYFQITGVGAVQECATIVVHQAHGLHEFSSSDAGAYNEVRVVGGAVPLVDRFPWKGYRLAEMLWGKGKPSAYEAQRIWNHTGS